MNSLCQKMKVFKIYKQIYILNHQKSHVIVKSQNVVENTAYVFPKVYYAIVIVNVNTVIII